MSGNAPALEKGLQVIELLLSSDEPLGMSLIAECLGYKVSEIQRMIEHLARERYLVRGASGAYSPGPKSFSLGDRNRDSALVARAEGPMRRYALKRGASVHLGVLVERMLHVVYGIDGGGMVRVGVKPGLYEAADSVSGRLLLAYRDPGSDAALADRGWNWGDVECARGVHIVAVRVATTSKPCAAVLASPYLSSGDGPIEPRMDLIEGLQAAAAEIAALC